MTINASTSTTENANASQDEYESAVSFLRDFHSQRVASLSLASISEDEDANVLATDFSLTVNIDVAMCDSSRTSRRSTGCKRPLHSTTIGGRKFTRLKKSASSKYLSDLLERK
jgi:hypothetical protein